MSQEHRDAATTRARFPIRFDAWYALLSKALFISPADSYVELSGDDVSLRMAWAFRASFPRSAITRAHRYDGRPLSRGVHGLAGRWLVNGSADGILVLTLDPPARGRVMGVSVELRELMVSVDEPEALARLLQPAIT
jgi:hypothetical protein